MDKRLQQRRANTLVITGAERGLCVLGTFLGAIGLGYRVDVVADARCTAMAANPINRLYPRPPVPRHRQCFDVGPQRLTRGDYHATAIIYQIQQSFIIARLHRRVRRGRPVARLGLGSLLGVMIPSRKPSSVPLIGPLVSVSALSTLTGRCFIAYRCLCRSNASEVGYTRVSKADGSQVLDLQRDALIGGGVSSDHLYEDHASGKRDDRPGLDACLKSLRKVDTLVAWKLDRIDRDLRHLVNLVHDLTNRGVGLRVLAGEGAAIDTTTPNGRLMFGFFAALAEFERELIVERTKAGLASARARGRNGGRPFKNDHRQAASCPGRHGSARY